jgi:hypothetical protein
MAANRVLGGAGGLGLLLSGLPALLVAFAILYGIAWAIAPKFYDVVDYVLKRINHSFHKSYQVTKRQPKMTEAEELLIPLEDRIMPPGAHEQQANDRDYTHEVLSTRKAIAVSFTTLTLSVVVLFLQFVRPTTPPYAHMSGSLPVTLIEAALFQPINSEFCLAHPVERVIFPWEPFGQYFGQPESLDWMPQSSACSRRNDPGPSTWLEHPGGDGPQGRPPPGPPRRHTPPSFQHHHERAAHDDAHHPPPWSYPDHEPSEPFRHGHGAGYDHLCDPLKLSNLDANISSPLLESIQSKKPTIKNVLFLTLESTRKDMFPLKKHSHAYNTILSSYASFNATDDLDRKLRNLTSVATFLSGESNKFATDAETAVEGSWKNEFREGMGGINVQGAITQAAYTLKSLLSSHCGVEPLPVDFTEETHGQIYQSCLPQVLDTISKAGHGAVPKLDKKDGSNLASDHRTWPWESYMIQSVTDQFDSQDVLDDQMGFRTVISERTLSDPASKHYPPKQPWVNYFGYPETESLDYLRDMFVDARQQQKRLFVSHLTSSPHHPFATPKDWPARTEYLGKQRWRPEDPLEGYLNTIKFQDDWISDILQMLHEVGALKETLIVMTGDHGLAFKSLDQSQSAVNNGHISNFAIPLLFIHPDLPRLQLKASTTPLSIIPTVLDLLLQTGSLSEPAVETVNTLLPKYQGNSMIRELSYSVLTADGGMEKAFFKPFHFSAINPGGSLLAISDASTSFRLIFPLCSSIPLRFTDIASDPTETDPAIAWTLDELIAIIKVKHGTKAKEWVKLAQELGRWWFWEQREKWDYWGYARSTGRGGAEVAGAGRVKKKHWWETKR